MTSGIGYQGGRYALPQFDADDSSRCYGFWQDYYDCYGTGSAAMGMELTCSECGPSKAVQPGSRQLHGMSASYEGGNSFVRSLLMQKSRVERIRQEWAKQQKAGHLPRTEKLEFNDEESKKIVSRLGFIDGSGKQSKAGT